MSSRMTYRMRKRLSLIVLLIWLPVYIVVVTTLVSALDRPHILVEAGIYVVLGVLWALPFRWLFRGVGREDPDERGG